MMPSEFLFFVADEVNSVFYKLFGKKRAMRNFEHNRKTYLAATSALCGKFIASQRPLKNFRFGIKDLAYGGCGIIAVHNVLAAKKKEKNLPDLVREFEKNALVLGLFGISPCAICKYLENEGFETQRFFGKKRVKNADPCGKSIICFYFRRNLTAHFVAAVPADENHHLFLNSHLKEPCEMTFREFAESLFEKEKPIFVCSYAIK